jgi:hypothetical protein
MYNADFNKSLKMMGFAGLLIGSVATIAYVSHTIVSNTPARDYATLIPANDPMPEHWCNEKAGNRFMVYFGDYLVVINGFPNRVLSLANEDMLVIDKDKAGNIIINSKLSGIFQHHKSQTKVVMRMGGLLNLPGTQPYSNFYINNNKYAVDFNFP